MDAVEGLWPFNPSHKVTDMVACMANPMSVVVPGLTSVNFRKLLPSLADVDVTVNMVVRQCRYGQDELLVGVVDD